MIRQALLCAVVFACALASAAPSNAATINDQSTTGFINPTVINFGAVAAYPHGTAITNQFPGVTFGPNYGYRCCDAGVEFAGGHLFGPDNSSQPGSIKFANDVTEAAFTLMTNPGSTLFQAYNDGVLVASFSGATDGNPNSFHYFGFSGLLFDEIKMTITAVNGGPSTAFFLDNLEYNVAQTPLPAALPLFATVLAGGGVMAWRRKRKQERRAS